jgi:hypothetical protein
MKPTPPLVSRARFSGDEIEKIVAVLERGETIVPERHTRGGVMRPYVERLPID